MPQTASHRLALAQDRLLLANDLDLHHLQAGLSGLWARGADYGDLYFESTTRDSWARSRAQRSRSRKAWAPAP
jgi:TldD protein